MAKIKKIAMMMWATVIGVMFSLGNILPAYAAQAFSMSPMNESIILSPGDEYESSFRIHNLSEDEDFAYEAEVGPYYVNEDYEPVFVNEGDRNRIVDWITLKPETQRGVIKPNEEATIEFVIKVPESAAAGGQYACISVGSDAKTKTDGDGEADAAISESLAIGYTVFAEITGTSEVSGEILDMSIPSFLIGGKIHAISQVKNTGNVHSVGEYTMTVKSVFSDEILYDSSKVAMEGDDTHTVFPDRTYTEEEYWQDTPIMGIFDVTYKVEYQGKTSEISGVVIVCPWWILAIFAVGLILMTLRIVTLMKISKKRKAEVV